ncbi:MAG: dihydrodipicolinate synthase family protein [Arachnia sp.]
MTSYRGVIPPICTPFTADGGIDEDSLHRIVEFQLDAGAAGIFVLGSSGEVVYLSDRDRLRVLRIAAAAVRGRVPLLVGALAPTTNRVIQQLDMLAGHGADAFVVTAPFYAAMSQLEILQHFRMAAAAASAPVLAYDIPGNVGYKLSPVVAVELLADATLAGLKDSSGEVEVFTQIAAALGPERGAAMLSGADTTALLALHGGADGLIPGLSNIRPDLFVALLRAHRDASTAEAEALQRGVSRLNQIFGIGTKYGLGRHAAEIGALKHILGERGVIQTTRPAAPLEPFPAAARDEATALMHAVDATLAADLAESSKAGTTHV